MMHTQQDEFKDCSSSTNTHKRKRVASEDDSSSSASMSTKRTHSSSSQAPLETVRLLMLATQAEANQAVDGAPPKKARGRPRTYRKKTFAEKVQELLLQKQKEEEREQQELATSPTSASSDRTSSESTSPYSHEIGHAEECFSTSRHTSSSCVDHVVPPSHQRRLPLPVEDRQHFMLPALHPYPGLSYPIHFIGGHPSFGCHSMPWEQPMYPPVRQVVSIFSPTVGHIYCGLAPQPVAYRPCMPPLAREDPRHGSDPFY